MLKNFRLIAMVLVFAASNFGAFAQDTETNNYKDVLLDGKPARLNLVTGEITFTNGEIATSRIARKIKDSVLDNRTEIKTNLIKDMSGDALASKKVVLTDSTNVMIVDAGEGNSTISTETKISELSDNPSETNDYKITTELLTDNSFVSKPSVDKSKETIKTNTHDFHMVKKGETLYQLSKRYETSLGQLKIANNLETTLIKEGETLRVRNFEPLETESNDVWIVSKGDTLYNIAKQNNITVDDLKGINGLSSNLIKIGQKLHVNQNSTLSKK
ncbi:LysM peptidoglycan-binding domain-containing protein [Psychroserpens ponticola]|uniref:LysM peptidoglycan-binding domain-containing protein n=1 Tax=Psychroserpens ponticola TaxID=2932268 RepID=A0ABY7S3L8_9FLAO|nr:LysM peptidoglycan-binding domain-containing protein [Psychroserpens ponticola]WCO03046.1 LysM peptidoglycan-binding domain-containing protein [Psychroserpens ponticola]